MSSKTNEIVELKSIDYRLKQKNYVLLGILLGFIVILYFITIIKLSNL